MFNSRLPFRSEENDKMVTYLHTEDTPSHLEADLYLKGNLLYSMNQAILTTNGVYKDLIVGQSKRNPLTQIPYKEGQGPNAIFTRITSFTQQNNSHVLIADSKHGCVRSVNRLTNSTHLVVGNCKTVYYADEYADGPLAKATFHEIQGLAYKDNIIYVIQAVKAAVRKVDLFNGFVTTIVNETNLRKYDSLRSLAIHPKSNTAYLPTWNGIAKIELVTDVFSYLNKKGEKTTPNDGSLVASTWSAAREIVLISKNSVLVVASGKLQVIDLQWMTVDSWCFRYRSNNCSVDRYVESTAIMDCMLYLSIQDTIQMLQLPSWFCGKNKGIFPTTLAPSLTTIEGMSDGKAAANKDNKSW